MITWILNLGSKNEPKRFARNASLVPRKKGRHPMEWERKIKLLDSLFPKTNDPLENKWRDDAINWIALCGEMKDDRFYLDAPGTVDPKQLTMTFANLEKAAGKI